MKPTNHAWRFLLILCMLVAWSSLLSAQSLRVKGTVSDLNGQPVIGAGIVEKGTTNGVVSDLDGSFALTVQPGAILSVSCIGYVTVEEPAAAQVLVVLQEDNEMLEETIVVGYGVQRKSDVTGAISKVEASQLANRTVVSTENALAGKTSGLQMINSNSAPGASSSIRIRGYSSNYTSDPLYIVDGLKVRSISSIDANDIESIEVLKDAASAAIYGAEAGNGVILVTTKRAAAGKTSVSYDFQYSATSFAHMPEVMNAQEYMQYYTEKNPTTYSSDFWKSVWDGKTDNQWYKTATETSSMMRHTLSFQNASEKSNVFISLNYLDQDGFIKGDDDVFKRYNLTLNAELKIAPWLTVGNNTRLNYSTNTTRPVAMADGYAGGIFTSLIELDPLTPVFYENNAIPSAVQALIDQGYNYPTSADGRYFGTSQIIHSTTTQNPLFSLEYNKYDRRGVSINTNVYVNLMPVKGLVITSRLGGDFSNSYTRTYGRTYYASPYQNSTTGASVGANSPSRLYYQWENFANYTHSFGKHVLTGMAGMSFSQSINNTLDGFVVKLTKEADNFAYLNYAADDAVKSVSGETLITGKLSYFGRIGYTYADKYILEATFRADANDLSVLSKKNRWGYFPAISAGWILSKESFFPKNPVFTFAKLRASWGRNGSISSLGGFMYTSAIDSSRNYSMDGTTNYHVAALPSTLGNDSLTWETSEQVDLGVDLRFLSDRLSVTVDWYDKQTKDLLIQGVNPSLTAGNSPSPVNAGNVYNRGVDIDLIWKDHFGAFTYGISGNLGFLKNRVSYLDPTVSRINGANAVGRNRLTYFEEGYPIWYMRGYRVEGIDSQTGNPVFKDVDKNGVFSPNDVEQIGSGIPDLTYGITLTAGWKNFDLLIFGSGAHGNDIFMNLNSVNDEGFNKLKLYYDERWTPSHTEATRPRPGCDRELQYLMSDASVFDGSYFKIKQIQLGYSFAKKVLDKIHLSRARAYVSLDDFLSFTKYPGLDPESSSVNATSGIGIDSGAYPTSKKVVFGLNLTF